MKKTLFFAAAMLIAGTMTAQTIVSTTPSNRNVIIEEFTGVNCTWCPAGHKIANELMAANPGRLWAINVHQGGYAQGSGYTTQWGDALANQSGLEGYPSGTVNRHVFTGNHTALGRGNWAQASSLIMDMESPVNVGAVATFDADSRTISINVELYYTGNPDAASNYLNVALIQDNVIGPQVGAASNYPEMVVGNQYRHNHMLRDLLTGQWGEQIDNIAAGTLVERTYTYQVPASIGEVPVPSLSDLHVIVFVAKSHQEIITGVEATRIFNRAFLTGFNARHDDECSLEWQPYVVFNNTTDHDVSNVTLNYDGNEVNFSRTIAAGEEVNFDLPAYIINPRPESHENYAVTREVSLVSYEEDGITTTFDDTPMSLTFADVDAYTVAGTLHFDLALDHYASETTVKLVKQSDCSVVFQCGPFTDRTQQSLQPARHHYYNFSPAEAGIYILEVLDSYGDGMTYATAADPSGFAVSTDEGQLFRNDGDFGAEAVYYFNITTNGSGSFLGIDETEQVNVTAYPNPASTMATINAGSMIRNIEVVNSLGQKVYGQQNVNSESFNLNVSGLASGLYFVTVTTDRGIATERLSVVK